MDSAFSLEPDEVRQLVEQTEIACQAVGRVQYDPVESEKTSLRFRRSLYVVQNVTAGEAFTTSNVRAIRPGFGLAPKHLQAVLGRTAAHEVERGTPMGWDLLA